MLGQRALEKATDLALKNRYRSDLKQLTNYIDEMLDIRCEQSIRAGEDESKQREICNAFIELRDFLGERLNDKK